jgi:hypothetical protein
MTEETKKSIKFWCSMGAPLVVGIIVFLVMVFPTTNFNDTSIRMFAPGRMSFDSRGFRGRVLGNHVLETEHGAITLRHFARIYSTRYRDVGIIEESNFTRGRASHNLVVEGIIIPPNTRIVFNSYTQRISILVFAVPIGDLQDFQKIEVSGIPLRVGRIYFERPRTVADIVMIILASGYVTLTDDTQIYLTPLPDGSPSLHGLHIYKEDERWRIIIAGRGMTGVKRLGETEFTEYRSVIFRPHWGEFIEGVSVE